MNLGVSGSILQELSLFMSIHNMFAIVLKLQKKNAETIIFDEFCEINSKSFQYILSILCRHVKDILNMCMKNYVKEKKYFFANLQHFEHG